VATTRKNNKAKQQSSCVVAFHGRKQENKTTIKLCGLSQPQGKKTINLCSLSHLQEEEKQSTGVSCGELRRKKQPCRKQGKQQSTCACGCKQRNKTQQQSTGAACCGHNKKKQQSKNNNHPVQWPPVTANSRKQEKYNHPVWQPAMAASNKNKTKQKTTCVAAFFVFLLAAVTAG